MLSTIFVLGIGLRPRANTWVLPTIININRPDGATYSQTVYVSKYSQRARGLEVNVLSSEHLIYH